MTGLPSVGLHESIQKVFGCSPDVAVDIARQAVVRRYPVQTVIIKQGERPESTFLLVSGRAQALLYGSEGQTVLLHEFLAGDFFGAVADLEAAPAESDVIAVDEVRAAVFHVLEFVRLAEQYGCIGLAISRTLLKQLRSAGVRMAERTILSASGRIHAELLRLARLGDGRTIRPVPILSALAVRVHSTRETVSRTINALERRGIIRREDNALVIVAPHRLEEAII